MNIDRNIKSQSGFTLIELLVVIAIIGLLAAIIFTAFSSARAKARDAKRKADLTQLQKAIELFYYENNEYPWTGGFWYGVNAPASAPSIVQQNDNDSGNHGWIPLLAPTYVAKLPRDPSGSSEEWAGYFYKADQAAQVYKLILNAPGPESFPGPGEIFYDPCRPGTAWMVTNQPNETGNLGACSTW